MSTIENFDEFVNESLLKKFNIKGFLQNVKAKIKKDISDYVDIDPRSGLITVIIPFDPNNKKSYNNITLNDVDEIESIAKLYANYYKGTNVDGDNKSIYIKFYNKW